MKKLFFALTLVAALISIGYQSRTAEAADYYLGVYDDGREAYLMTESIVFTPDTAYPDDFGKYDCKVKAVNVSSQRYSIANYAVTFGMMGPVITKSGRVYDRHEMQRLRQQPNSVEMKLVSYIEAYRKNNR